GLDRRKMSKSYNNAIYLSDSGDEVATKVAGMITDPNRARKNDPGDPDICNVFDFHKRYSDPATISTINEECRKAAIGCVECKKIMAKNLVIFLEPLHEKREYYKSRPDLVESIFADGSEKARGVALQTMAEVRAAVKMQDSP
ncbi:MAG: tryptophan--tRNA ligase, partial [Deltaproteobacteria bacterium]|nr:tryptophan--tRNA ligase [Deltaproteobacteria bacterium]